MTATQTAQEKETALVEWLRSQGSVLIGFSGGVDSAYLACVAIDALGAEKVLAVIGRSASYPMEQWTRAREVADRFGVPVLELDTDELSDPRYAANPTNRCYFCKTELWSRLVPVARERGLAAVIDGTNADDTHGHRPGKGAAVEHGVRSPLAELGFTKDEIRALSHERDILTWPQRVVAVPGVAPAVWNGSHPAASWKNRSGRACASGDRRDGRFARALLRRHRARRAFAARTRALAPRRQSPRAAKRGGSCRICVGGARPARLPR